MSNPPKPRYAQLTAEYIMGGVTEVHENGAPTPWRVLPEWLAATPRPLPGEAGRRWRPCCCRTADGRCYFYGFGETLVVPRNLPHRFENPNASGSYSVWCHFHLWQAPGIDAFRRLAAPLVIGGADSVRIAAATRTLAGFDPAGAPDLASNCAIRGALFTIAAVIAEHAGIALEPEHAHEEELEFWPLLAYIQKHLHQRLPLDELAGRMHRSPSVFRENFRRLFGISPGRYILQARLNLGAQLLRTPRLSIGEIAARTGFSDAFSFSKAFRQYFGMAPRDYRHTSPV